jgi:patatin-like phospholipase/acyl hydrolase
MAHYTIVSFCGGGIRGLLSARILERLAAIRPSILNTTTLLAGTSTGAGIVSFLLANHGPAQICSYYLDQERKFFAHPKSKDAKDPAYSVDDVALGVFAVHGDKQLRQFEQKVLFTAFYVGAHDVPWAPILFSNVAGSTNAETTVVDAVTSSSAMPGMMGSWHGHVDGAFVNHDPTLAAIALALSSGARFEDIAVINIGTGLMPDYIGDDTHTWGAEQWQNGGPLWNLGNRTPKFLINGSVSPVLDMALCGTSANLTPMLARMMLGERYVNLNPRLDWYIPENATSDRDLDELQAKAASVDLTRATALLEAYWPATL